MSWHLEFSREFTVRILLQIYVVIPKENGYNVFLRIYDVAEGISYIYMCLNRNIT